MNFEDKGSEPDSSSEEEEDKKELETETEDSKKGPESEKEVEKKPVSILKVSEATKKVKESEAAQKKVDKEKKRKDRKDKKDTKTKKNGKDKGGKVNGKDVNESKKRKSAEMDDKEKSLAESEKDLPGEQAEDDKQVKNSNTNRAEWQCFGRWASNKKRCPAKLIAACKDPDRFPNTSSTKVFGSHIPPMQIPGSNKVAYIYMCKQAGNYNISKYIYIYVDNIYIYIYICVFHTLPQITINHQSVIVPMQDTRLKLFNDWMDCGKDYAQVEACYQQRLEETQKSTIKWGFRNDVWIKKHYGDKKAEKIMARKKQLGLTLGCIGHGMKIILGFAWRWVSRLPLPSLTPSQGVIALIWVHPLRPIVRLFSPARQGQLTTRNFLEKRNTSTLSWWSST